MWPVLAGYRAGKLWIWDQQLSRVVVIDESLDVVESTPTKSGYVVALADSGKLAYPMFLSTARVPLLHFTAESEIVDTVTMLPRGTGYISVPLENGGVRVPQPFDRGVLWRLAPSGDGVVLVDQVEARLHGRGEVSVVRISTVGDTLFAVGVPVTTQPMTRALLEGIVGTEVDRVRDAAATRGDSLRGDALERVFQQVEVPAFLPPVVAVFLDIDGRTWLELRPDGAETDLRWIVVGPTGRVLMHVVDGSNWQFLGARGSRVWLTRAQGDGGGARVVQFRLGG